MQARQPRQQPPTGPRLVFSKPAPSGLFFRSSAQEETPIIRLRKRIGQYLHLPDAGILYSVLGTIAANMIQGNHVWLMLVGPPSSGKTALLYSLLGIPRVVELDEISGPAALLSGTSQRERAQNATGGVLRKLGRHGCLLIDDLTGVLSMPSERLRELLGAFRGLYKGKWVRALGSDGGRTLIWEGRIGIVSGCTEVIDLSHEASQTLGERWVYYRYQPTEPAAYEMSRRALLNSGNRNWRQEVQDLIAAFFLELGMRFDPDSLGMDCEEDWMLKPAEFQKVYRLSRVVAKCRSALIRDNYRKEILAPASEETPTRVATILSQLLIGLKAIEVPEADRWRVLRKVAFDSMPRLRRMILEILYNQDEGIVELASKTGVSRGTVDRNVTDLEAFGMLRKVLRDRKARVSLSAQARREIDAIGGIGEWVWSSAEDEQTGETEGEGEEEG